MSKLYFDLESGSGHFCEVIENPDCGQIGMDCRGDYWQYWQFNGGGWNKMYDWPLAVNGIYEGWEYEQDLGDMKQWIIFRGGYFWLTSNWNNAEAYGFRYWPILYSDWRRFYHLVTGDHFRPTGPVSYPYLLELQRKAARKEP